MTSEFSELYTHLVIQKPVSLSVLKTVGTDEREGACNVRREGEQMG